MATDAATPPGPAPEAAPDGKPNRLRDYLQLSKLRLSAVVVFSAFVAFLAGSHRVGGSTDWLRCAVVVLAGFAVTASSNTLNQIIEIGRDARMRRTAGRPLPAGRMQPQEAFWFAGILGLAGVAALWFWVNPLSGWLGLTALMTYAFAYTPLKRMGPVAVYVGAIPGAMPVLIGYAAAVGTLDAVAGSLFAIQFVWQFPHFWAIAWLAHDEYRKAGYHLLPTLRGRDRTSAAIVIAACVALGFATMLPLLLGVAGWPSAGLGTVFAGALVWLAVQLYRTLDNVAALRLMLAALVFLPLVLLAVYFDLH